METIRGCWSYKELERQINSLYYERSGLSQNKEALSALVQRQATQLQPKDIINTSVTLEFLGLNDRALVTIRPEYLRTEVHDRTSKRGRNKGVHCFLKLLTYHKK